VMMFYIPIICCTISAMLLRSFSLSEEIVVQIKFNLGQRLKGLACFDPVSYKVIEPSEALYDGILGLDEQELLNSHAGMNAVLSKLRKDSINSLGCCIGCMIAIYWTKVQILTALLMLLSLIAAMALIWSSMKLMNWSQIAPALYLQYFGRRPEICGSQIYSKAIRASLLAWIKRIRHKVDGPHHILVIRSKKPSSIYG